MAAIDGALGAEPLLTTSGLTKSFRSLVALKNHDIVVRAGEIVGVIGPNGSGKSTFFNVVSGFLRADRGAIRFDGAADRAALRLRDRAARHRAHVSGHAAVPAAYRRGKRACRGPAAPSDEHGRRGARHCRSCGGARRRSRRSPHELLELVGLASACRHAGERAPLRRPAAARADPGARHPPAAADARRAGGGHGRSGDPQTCCSSSTMIRHRYRLAVIVVEHDMDLIMNLCERIQVLAHGERIFEGTPAEVQAHPARPGGLSWPGLSRTRRAGQHGEPLLAVDDLQVSYGAVSARERHHARRSRRARSWRSSARTAPARARHFAPSPGLIRPRGGCDPLRRRAYRSPAAVADRAHSALPTARKDGASSAR